MGSLGQSAFPGLHLDTNDPAWSSKVAFVLGNILTGKLNNKGSVTLVNGGVSTSVSDARCGPTSVILLMATSALGAVALDQWWTSTRTNGSFVVTHVSTSTANCTADYVILG